MNLKTLLATASLLMLATPALAQQGPNPPPPPPPGEGPGFFDRADLNKDGAISLDEVRTARGAMFDRIDKNKDGVASEEEMQAARPSRPPRPEGMPNGRRSQGQADDFHAQADANKDGSVTKAEFDVAMANRARDEQTRSQERANEAFARLDTKKAGRISREEADAARGSMMDRMKDRKMSRRDGPPPPPSPASFDTNKDGKISRDEWLARPDPMFERADANKDGRVTREEAAAAARQGREGGPGRGPGRPW